jgi:ABC-type transport system involved in multi-copper enzyme maturation permease subunit
MSLVMRLLPDNPVLTKELRSRMRGARAYWIMFGYIGFLSLVLMVSYYAWKMSVESAGSGSSMSSELGGQIFIYILVTQIFLVLFITPAITSGSLTIEREQRTMDMLDLTPMPRRSIIIGKLMAAVSFTALLIISSLPLISICFMLGSVDPAQVLSAYLEMLLGSFLVGAMGLMWSSIARTTTQAVIYTYMTMFLMVIAGGMVYGTSANSRGGDMITNIGQSIGSPWFSNQFLGIKTLEGTGFVVLCVLGGILMAAVARVRLEMFPERKAWMLRGLTLLIVGVELLGADLWWLNAWYGRGTQIIQTQIEPPTGVLMVTVLALMLLVPIFATGELKAFEARRFFSHLAWGWTPKGLSRGKLASGLPFLLIATALCLGIYALSFALVGKAGEINKPFNSPRTIAATTVLPTPPPIIGPNGKLQQPPPPPKVDPLIARASSPAYAQMIGGFPQIAGMLFAFVIGFSLLCLFLSVAFRNRWVALMLAYLLLIAIWIVPTTSMGNGSDVPTGVSVNLYYLNPAMAIFQITEPVQFVEFSRHLNFKDVAMAHATANSWLGFGLLSLLLTLPFIQRERKKNAEIPFEEMVANA